MNIGILTKYRLLLVGLAIVFGSCSKEQSKEYSSVGGAVELNLKINAPAATAVLHNETDINRLRVVIFGSIGSADAGKLVLNKYYDTTPAGNQFKETITAGKRDIFIIANEPLSGDGQELDSYKKIAAVADIRSLSLIYEGAVSVGAYVPAEIPMFAEHQSKQISINSTNEISGEVERTMAKVTMKLNVKNDNFKADKFVVIDSMVIKNLPQRSFLKANVYSDALVTSESQNTAVVAAQSGYDFSSNNTFYVPEYIFNNTDNGAYLEITGHVNGEPTRITKWAVKLGNAMDDAGTYGNRYDITRNRHYVFTGDVKSYGEMDELELNVKVLPWNTVDMSEDVGSYVSYSKVTNAENTVISDSSNLDDMGTTINISCSTNAGGWYTVTRNAKGTVVHTSSPTAAVSAATIQTVNIVIAKLSDFTYPQHYIVSIYHTTIAQESVGPVKTLSFTQNAQPPTISLNTTAQADIPSAGGSYTVKVTSNYAWSVSSTVSGVKFSQSNGLADEEASVVIAVPAAAATRSIPVVFTATAVETTATATWTGSQAAPAVISLNTTAQASIPSAGSSYTLKLTSNYAWSVSSTVSGVTFSPSSGAAGTNTSVTVTVPAHTATSSRSIPVVFTTTGGGTTATATWAGSQLAVPVAISVTPTSQASIPPAGSSYTVRLTSNYAWSVSSAGGATISPSSGVAGTNTSVTVTVPAHTAISSRSIPVVFTGTGGGTTTTARWNGSQLAIPAAISVTPTSQSSIPSSGASYTVQVTSNYAWKATSTVSGVAFSPSSGAAGANTSVTVTVPATVAARSVPVVFTGTGGGVTTTATWAGSQLAASAAISVTPTTQSSIPSAGSSYTVQLTSNYAWSVSSAGGATISPSSGAAGTNMSVTVTVPANALISALDIPVVFTTTGGGTTATTTWTGSQLAKRASFSVTPNTQTQIPFNGVGCLVKLTSDYDWSVSSTVSGVTFSPSKVGPGKDISVIITVPAHTSLSARSIPVVFTTTGSGTTTTATWTGTQNAAMAYITLGTTYKKDVPSSGGKYISTVTSNVAWSVSSTGGTTVSPSSGAAGTNIPITITVPANYGAAREVVMVVRCTLGTTTDTATWTGYQLAAGT